MPISAAIVTPMRSEYAAVRAAFKAQQAAGGQAFFCCGVGQARAEALCARLAAMPDLELLVLAGWAGGLDPALQPGAAVIANAALDLGGRQSPCLAVPIAGARVGPLLTAPRTLVDPVEKRLGALTGALAVEMEAYPLACWAAERRIRFVHVRIVLDGAEESVPLANAFDPSGRPHLAFIARAIAQQPALMRDVWRLIHRTRAFAPALGNLALRAVGAAQI